MKYSIFALAMLIGVPAMVSLAMNGRRYRQWLMSLLIISTCFGTLGKINFVSLETYRGPDRGFEITLTDQIALSLNIAMLVRFRDKIRWVPPRTVLMVAMLLWAMISVSMSPVPLYGLFTVFKLCRMFCIYWCIVNLLRIGTPIRGLWAGILGTAAILTVLGLKQKYINGYYRIPGPFDHSNTIPLYANLLIAVLLVWAIADRKLKPWESAASLAGALGLTFCVLATYSRAGIALAGGMLIIAMVVTNMRGFNPRSLAISGVVFLLLVGGGIKAAGSLIKRVKEAPKSSEQARQEFNAAARMMLHDHPFGVGVNNFSYVLTSQTSYNRFLKVMKNESQAGVCHHIYNLTAAEVGFPGITLFLLLILSFCWTALRAWYRGGDLEAKLLFGLFLGAVALHLQGLLEWGFRITPVMQMFTITSAMIVGLASQLDRRASSRKRERRTESCEIIPAVPTPEGVLL